MTNNRIHSHLDEIDMIGKLADLKNHQYQSTLLLSALIELLQEKGILTIQELTEKARDMERRDIAGLHEDETPIL